MREYKKPIIEEEVIELEDIIAASSNGPMESPNDNFDDGNPDNDIIDL